MKRIWWKIAVGMVIVFSSGLVTGVVGTVVVGAKVKERAEDPAIGHAMALNHLTRKLDLDERQRTEVSGILSEMFAEIVEIRDDTRDRLASVVKKHAPRIRAVLRDDQIAPFEGFLSKLEREWQVVFRPEPKDGSPPASGS